MVELEGSIIFTASPAYFSPALEKGSWVIESSCAIEDQAQGDSAAAKDMFQISPERKLKIAWGGAGHLFKLTTLLTELSNRSIAGATPS
jgi:hypothetical protein